MTSERPMPVYAPGSPLPQTGLRLLEASAGTGKTFTITELVRRYVTRAGIPLDQLLVMTFSRSAAQELRDRIRQELRSTAAAAPADSVDRVRSLAALGQFDDAAIMTIHEFCIDAFARFGLRADADPDEQVAEDLAEVLQDAVADTYLSLFWQDPPLADPTAGKPRTTDLSAGDAHGIAKALLGNPDAELLTRPEAGLRPEQARIDFAQRVTDAVERSKHEHGVISFDDMVLRLRDAVRDDPAVRERLRSRFRVVLIDEFQDTDPSQWAIVRDAFLEPAAPDTGPGPAVVLIGDPKQGIYSFRGADIHSYTAARDTPGTVAETLGTNYRSDAPVVEGVLDLLGGLDLGSGITVGPVDAHHRTTRISGPAMDAAGARVRLRAITDPPAAADPLRRLIACDIAEEIVRTLRIGAEIPAEESGSGPATTRAVVPGDFAVIVRTNKQAELVRSTLIEFGVPAVVNSQISVYASTAARSWLRLLRALERPTAANVRAAALTEFLGTPAEVLADPEDPGMERVAERIKHMAGLFHTHGAPALLAAAEGGSDGGEGIYARLLARPDGERLLTDLRHVGSLLHQEHRRSRRGLTSLADWLEEHISEAGQDADERAEALTRRLETDADAVQVLTIHRCKGLQFGIVYVPFGYVPSSGRNAAVVCTTDEDSDPPAMRRIIDVRSYRSGSRKPALRSQTERLKDLQKAEAGAEELRMLYVALTRGIHEVVLWWAPHRDTARSPLQRVLGAESGEPAPRYQGAPLDKARAARHVALQEVPAASIGGPPAPGARPTWQTGPREADQLAAAPYTRADIDAAWRRSSFTALTRGAPHGSAVALEVEVDDLEETSDEGGARPEAHGAEDREPGPGDGEIPSPMAGLPGGTAFGSLVHAVLEHTDPQAEDLPAELRRRSREQLARRPVAGVSPDSLARALEPPMRTPLGPLAGGRTLADIATRDRLAEMVFEMPLQQDRGAAETVASIGRLLTAEEEAPSWVREYGEALQTSGFSWKELRGYLTGSIDAVLRVDGRFLVVDYKTNLVGPPEGTVREYRSEALARAMVAAHYPLQALLYSAALHRFLGCRLPGYDPDRHLGGVLYLFLRGMAGGGAPVGPDGEPHGVFSWQPSARLVAELSGVLGGVA